MKLVALLIALAGTFPLALYMQSNPWVQRYAWVALGSLPFLLRALHIDFGLISWGNRWIGYVYGIEISMLDIIAFGLFLISRKVRLGFNFHVPFILYLAAIALSIFQADEPLAAVFYLWQFMKVYFIALVVARACIDENVPVALLKGMAFGLFIQIFVIAWQKWGLHAIQPSGTFLHQNTLGLAAHFVVFPHMMLLLSGIRRLQFIVTPVSGLLIAALTASRAALGFCAFGLVLCLAVSVLRRWTAHKARIAVIGVMGALLIAPVAVSSFQKRFDAVPLNESEYDERAAFNRAAIAIVEDHPLGIGANHYVHEAKNAGYSIRAGVAPFEGNLNNIVHNAYLLAASETGYFGAASFILILVCPLLTALRYGWVARRTRLGDLLLGCAIALTVVCLHSFLEYIFFGKDIQYLFAILVGLIHGSAASLRRACAHRQPSRLSGRAALTGLTPSDR